MTLTLDKSAFKRVALGDVAESSKEKCDPTDGSVERYVAGEHMDTDSLKITRWGVIGDGYLGPAFHRRFHPGQVLYGSRRTYLRKVAVADFDGVCANTTFVIQPRSENVLLRDFLPLVLTAEPFHAFAIAESKGSVNPYVNWSDVANYEFGLPPLDEQKRIAELMWAIENHQNRLSSLSETLRQGASCWLEQRLLDEPSRRLDEMVVLQHGRPVPSELYGKEGVPLLRPGDMKPDGTITWTAASVCVPRDFAERNSEWLLSAGDVVINMTAQSLEDRFLGRVCRMHEAALLNQRIGRLRPISSDTSEAFVHLALSSRAFTDWVARRCEGSKVKHMHWRHIQDFPFPCPPLASQQDILRQASSWHHAGEVIRIEEQALATTRGALSRAVFGDVA